VPEFNSISECVCHSCVMTASFAGKVTAILNRCSHWAQPILNHFDVILNTPRLHQTSDTETRCRRLKQALERCLISELSIDEARDILASISDISRFVVLIWIFCFSFSLRIHPNIESFIIQTSFERVGIYALDFI
jgi:hypothetical protein